MDETTREQIPAYYSTYGSTRGGCGHVHRSLATAESCRRRDQTGCERQGGYSDREVRRCGGPLSDDEQEQLRAIKEG